MRKKLEVFDPPMLCSSCGCGEKMDKKLVQFSAALEWLRSHGVEVQRYNPTQQYDAFVTNPAVVKALNDGGIQCLPLILVDGEIVSFGGYPTKIELTVLVGIGREPEVKA